MPGSGRGGAVTWQRCSRRVPVHFWVSAHFFAVMKNSLFLGFLLSKRPDSWAHVQWPQPPWKGPLRQRRWPFVMSHSSNAPALRGMVGGHRDQSTNTGLAQYPVLVFVHGSLPLPKPYYQPPCFQALREETLEFHVAMCQRQKKLIDSQQSRSVETQEGVCCG